MNTKEKFKKIVKMFEIWQKDNNATYGEVQAYKEGYWKARQEVSENE